MDRRGSKRLAFRRRFKKRETKFELPGTDLPKRRNLRTPHDNPVSEWPRVAWLTIQGNQRARLKHRRDPHSRTQLQCANAPSVARGIAKHFATERNVLLSNAALQEEKTPFAEGCLSSCAGEVSAEPQALGKGRDWKTISTTLMAAGVCVAGIRIGVQRG
jgi:hypothetical protein